MEKQKAKSATPKGKTRRRTAKSTSATSKVPSKAPVKKIAKEEQETASKKSPATNRRITNADEQKKAVNTGGNNSYDEDNEDIDDATQRVDDTDKE